MQHVMVPVPEEHLTEVQAGLMRMSLGMAGWTDESIGALLDALGHLEPRIAALVREVAIVSADHDRLSYRDAARTLDVTVGEVLQLVTDLNDWCRRSGVPALLITDTSTVLGHDAESHPIPVLVTVPPVARKLIERWPPTEVAVTNP